MEWKVIDGIFFRGRGNEDNSNDCKTAWVFFSYSCCKAEGYAHIPTAGVSAHRPRGRVVWPREGGLNTQKCKITRHTMVRIVRIFTTQR